MITINLASDRPRSRPDGRGTSRLPAPGLGVVFGVLYLVAVGGLGWYWMTLTSEESRLRNEIAQATTTLEGLKVRIGQDTKFKEMLPELQKRLEAITILTKNQARPVRLADAFVDTVPADVWITTLEDKNGALKIYGSAFSATAVSEFMNNLRRSGRFKDVDILQAKQDLQKPPRLVTFEVTCRYES
jgi:Tfp pilus assembly protein PilN